MTTAIADDDCRRAAAPLRAGDRVRRNPTIAFGAVLLLC